MSMPSSFNNPPNGLRYMIWIHIHRVFPESLCGRSKRHCCPRTIAMFSALMNCPIFMSEHGRLDLDNMYLTIDHFVNDHHKPTLASIVTFSTLTTPIGILHL